MCVITWVVVLLTKAPTFLVKVVSGASEGDTIFTSLSQINTHMESFLIWQNFLSHTLHLAKPLSLAAGCGWGRLWWLSRRAWWDTAMLSCSAMIRLRWYLWNSSLLTGHNHLSRKTHTSPGQEYTQKSEGMKIMTWVMLVKVVQTWWGCTAAVQAVGWHRSTVPRGGVWYDKRELYSCETQKDS